MNQADAGNLTANPEDHAGGSLPCSIKDILSGTGSSVKTEWTEAQHSLRPNTLHRDFILDRRLYGSGNCQSSRILTLSSTAAKWARSPLTSTANPNDPPKFASTEISFTNCPVVVNSTSSL